MTVAVARTRNTTFSGHVAGLSGFIALGAVFLIASLPDAATLVATHKDWTWLAKAAEWSKSFKNVLPPMTSLLEWINYALAAYAGALFLVSLRHNRASLIGWGIGTAVLSACLLHGLAWVGVIAFVVGRFLAMVFFAVMGFFLYIGTWVAHFVYDYVISPLLGFFALFMGDWAWAGLLTAFLVVLAIAVSAEWLKSAALVVGALALVIGVLAGLSWLISLVPESFWTAVKSIAGTVLGWLLVAFVLAVVGQLFFDQLRSSKHAGSGQRGVVMGAIAVGSTLAILMLIGNVHDAYDLYPSVISNWARGAVFSGSPKLDAVVTLVVIGLCAVGVLRNLVRMRPEPDSEEFSKSLVYTIMGGIAALCVAALDKVTSND